jgi:hypothetical protein
MEWKDKTSYSQGDTIRIPSIWEISGDFVRITVHRHIHYNADDWLLSSNTGYDRHVLKSKELKEAQFEAINMVLRRANRIVMDMQNLKGKQNDLGN